MKPGSIIIFVYNNILQLLNFLCAFLSIAVFWQGNVDRLGSGAYNFQL